MLLLKKKLKLYIDNKDVIIKEEAVAIIDNKEKEEAEAIYRQ